ncbi:hypothetical protein [Roseimicrobium sp. ORNL1]|uniref:hypothetical protein n=1 Tax=Roseimicrobium sp. ORNL1 TaxID=2711231 RepID=UPI0013E19658|nr:hypothetical protein [Roseimicrobium sp. ORNL1]QIF02289.1 hypothetical protein G5S37_12395 [Roseimicrobium sp. ORNL1]
MKRLLTILCLGFATALSAQEPAPEGARLQELIDQLAAPKVRLRDEAQQALSQMIDSEPAMRAAMASHSSEEARLRLKRILKGFRDGLWTIEIQQAVSAVGLDRGPLRTAVKGTLLASLHSAGIEILDATDLAVVRTLGKSTTGTLTLRALAWAPDGKRIAFSNQSGAVMVEDDAGKRLLTLPPEMRQINPNNPNAKQMAPPVAVEFVPGTQSLLVFTNAGLTLHEPAPAGEPRRMSVKEIFPEITRNILAQSMAVSADGKAVGLAFEVPGPEDDLVAMLSLADMKVLWVSKISVTPRWIAVNQDGSEALVAMRERGVVRCAADAPLAITVSRSIDDLTSVAYAPDFKSAFLTSGRANAPVRQLAVPSGEEMWTAAPAPTGCYHVTILGPDQIAVKTFDNRILIWKKRQSTNSATR